MQRRASCCTSPSTGRCGARSSSKKGPSCFCSRQKAAGPSRGRSEARLQSLTGILNEAADGASIVVVRAFGGAVTLATGANQEETEGRNRIALLYDSLRAHHAAAGLLLPRLKDTAVPRPNEKHDTRGDLRQRLSGRSSGQGCPWVDGGCPEAAAAGPHARPPLRRSSPRRRCTGRPTACRPR